MGSLSSLIGHRDPDEQRCSQLAEWVSTQMQQTKGNFSNVLKMIRDVVNNQVRRHVLCAYEMTRDLNTGSSFMFGTSCTQPSNKLTTLHLHFYRMTRAPLCSVCSSA